MPTGREYAIGGIGAVLVAGAGALAGYALIDANGYKNKLEEFEKARQGSVYAKVLTLKERKIKNTNEMEPFMDLKEKPIKVHGKTLTKDEKPIMGNYIVAEVFHDKNCDGTFDENKEKAWTIKIVRDLHAQDIENENKRVEETYGRLKAREQFLVTPYPFQTGENLVRLDPENNKDLLVPYGAIDFTEDRLEQHQMKVDREKAAEEIAETKKKIEAIEADLKKANEKADTLAPATGTATPAPSTGTGSGS